MKILVTGANGQVGREFQNSGHLLSKSALDITSMPQITHAIDHYHPDIIINTAAYTAVDKAEQEPDLAFAVNRDGVRNLALACKAHNIPLIHISTDYVFDGSKATPYIEDDVKAPLNVYGSSKSAGEDVLQEIWHKHIILRTSWVFGQHGHNFVKTILRLALKETELKIVSDQVGCPTAAKDIADTLLLLAEKIVEGSQQWGVYHYCGNRAVSWYEFAKVIVQYYPTQVKHIRPILTSEFPTPAVRPKNSVLGMEKIRREFGVLGSDWEGALVIPHRGSPLLHQKHGGEGDY